jgi:hypothetical protein
MPDQARRAILEWTPFRTPGLDFDIGVINDYGTTINLHSTSFGPEREH